MNFEVMKIVRDNIKMGSVLSFTEVMIIQQAIDAAMLHGHNSAPTAPVSVPDDVMAAMQKVARIRLDLNNFDGDKRGILDCLSDAEEVLIEIVNRRAAMLQGSQPVTTPKKLTFEQWLSQQTGTIDVECGCVMTEVFFHWLRVAYEAGNSPVTPDGWIPLSERMPEKFIPVMVMYEDGEMWSAIWSGQFWDDGSTIPDPHSITHWREMPAAPRQEAE